MIIGVPRERKPGEKRVALVPDGVSELVGQGHKIVIETNAGVGAGFRDADYEEAGAKVVSTLKEVWDAAELITKVKEPAPEEADFFRPGLTVLSFLHLAPQPELTKQMVESGVTGLDYDVVQLDDGSLPILEPMSIIAGKLSIQCGAYGLQSSNSGRGVLLGGIPGVKPAKVVVIGAGAAGSSAARAALGLGAEVSILDINTKKLDPFINGYQKARTLISSPSAIAREVQSADLVIGSVLIPGALAPKLLTRPMVEKMPAGAVIVDICIDQGGMCESSKPTSIENPTFVENGVVHYCVPNMPALVPRTATEALTNATFPWIKFLAGTGIEQSITRSKPILRSLMTYKKQLVNKTVGDAVKMKCVDEIELMKLLHS